MVGCRLLSVVRCFGGGEWSDGCLSPFLPEYDSVHCMSHRASAPMFVLETRTSADCRRLSSRSAWVSGIVPPAWDVSSLNFRFCSPPAIWRPPPTCINMNEGKEKKRRTQKLNEAPLLILTCDSSDVCHADLGKLQIGFAGFLCCLKIIPIVCVFFFSFWEKLILILGDFSAAGAHSLPSLPTCFTSWL